MFDHGKVIRDPAGPLSNFKDFDAVQDVIGGFRKYQKLVVFLVIVPALLPTGFFAFNVVFMAATPDAYGCTIPVENFTIDDLDTLAPVEKRNGVSAPSRCRMYDVNYTSFTRQSLLDHINASSATLTTVPCTHGWVYSTAVYASTIVTDWDLVCDRDVYASLSFACSTVGGLFGTYLWAFLGDRCGRKPAFFSMVGFQLIFGIATAFAPSLIWFCIFRVCVGTCTSFLYTLGLLLSIEITGTETRALMSVICSNGYTFSVFVVLAIAYFTRTWRCLALASSAPLLILALLWRFFPESPRWLLAQKRFTDLEIYVKKVAKINGKILDAKFQANLPDILRHINAAEHVEKGTLLDLFRTRNMRKKTLLLAFINFCNMGIFTGLNLYAPGFLGSPYWNVLLSNLVELPPYLFAQYVCDHAGRRLSLFYPMLLCSVFCLATVAVAGSQATLILVLSLAAKFCITLTFLVGELWEEEIFPTVIRGQGHSFTIVASQLAGISVPFVVSLGSTFAVLPLVIFGSLCTVCAASALFLPETVRKELPQTLLDGETFGRDMTWKNVLTFVPVHRKKRKAGLVELADVSSGIQSSSSGGIQAVVTL